MTRNRLPMPGSNLLLEKHSISTIKQVSARELALCSQRKARKLLSFHTAWRIRALPLSIIRAGGSKEYITIAAASEFKYEDLQLLKFETGRELHIVQVPEETLKQAIIETYRGDPLYLQDVAQNVSEQSKGNSEVPARQRHVLTAEEGSSPDILVALIEHAAALYASDIHIKPNSIGEAHIYLRIQGILKKAEVQPLPHQIYLKLTNRIKVLAGCDISVKAQPQDGSFEMILHERTCTFRVSLLPTLHGEQVVMRLPGVRLKHVFDDLCLSSFARETLRKTFNQREGGVLLCGPTGSGKTTILYALLHELKKQELNIITIEDPVESIIDEISQVAVCSGTSYSETLRSVLRQDPDVLMVGEIRDSESAQTSIQATLTGHLLLSTIHARNVFEIFLRLRHFQISDIDIAQSIQTLLSVRLAPKLCDRCKVIDLQATKELGFTAYKSAGCTMCENTGHRGRVPITETLHISANIKHALHSGQSLHSCFQKSNYQGFYESAREQVKAGYISLHEASKFLKL